MLSCGSNTDGELFRRGADSQCVAGSAQLAVGDGFSEVLCGCNEPGGQIVVSGNTQTVCTAPAGTQFFFHYLATRTYHQIMPVVAASFPMSPLSDPYAKGNMIKVHSFKLTVPGTYAFKDAYDGGISGRIVVQ